MPCLHLLSYSPGPSNEREQSYNLSHASLGMITQIKLTQDSKQHSTHSELYPLYISIRQFQLT